MSRFLFFGEDGDGISLAYRLSVIEGEEVGFCIFKPGARKLGDNMGIEKFADMTAALRWAGRDAYLISDLEEDVSVLRKDGWKVYGGNSVTKRMENDRQFEFEVAQSCGVPVPHFHAVQSPDEAIDYIKKHPDAWCLKQLGHAPKEWGFVGKEDDGRDVILQLEWIKKHPLFKRLGNKAKFALQEKVEGIEFAVGAWWMGDDWLRDPGGEIVIGLNREHKKALHGDLGIGCGELGTVVKMAPAAKLFEMMLEPLTPFLLEKCHNVRLAIDANCGVVDGDEAWLFEYTVRNGYPIAALYAYMQESGAGKFFADLIDGVQGETDWKPGWCVGTEIGCGFYPHDPMDNKEMTWEDQPVEIELSEHVMPECLYFDPKEGIYRIGDDCPCIATVTYHDEDIGRANEQCVVDMEKVGVRAPVYRTDIGEKFEKEDMPKLQKWGWL
jgi:phosphoribosylamine---glycine ligase